MTENLEDFYALYKLHKLAEDGKSVHKCLLLVEKETGVCMLDLLSERRDRNLARPRQLAMWLARHCTTRSLPQIGRVMRRDHTTVMHGIGVIDRLRAEDPEVRALSDRLMSELRP